MISRATISIHKLDSALVVCWGLVRGDMVLMVVRNGELKIVEENQDLQCDSIVKRKRYKEVVRDWSCAFAVLFLVDSSNCIMFIARDTVHNCILSCCALFHACVPHHVVRHNTRLFFVASLLRIKRKPYSTNATKTHILSSLQRRWARDEIHYWVWSGPIGFFWIKFWDLFLLNRSPNHRNGRDSNFEPNHSWSLFFNWARIGVMDQLWPLSHDDGKTWKEIWWKWVLCCVVDGVDEMRWDLCQTQRRPLLEKRVTSFKSPMGVFPVTRDTCNHS